MKNKPCKICHKLGHSATFCFSKKNKAINKFGKEAKKHLETKNQWLQDNASSSGTWQCYLQIHEWCPRILTIETLTIEHVEPKGSHRDKAHDPRNLKPACSFCNGLKGSRSIEALSKEFPHLIAKLDF